MFRKRSSTGYKVNLIKPGSVEQRVVGLWLCDNCYVRVIEHLVHARDIAKVRHYCGKCMDKGDHKRLKKVSSNIVVTRMTPRPEDLTNRFNAVIPHLES